MKKIITVIFAAFLVFTAKAQDEKNFSPIRSISKLSLPEQSFSKLKIITQNNSVPDISKAETVTYQNGVSLVLVPYKVSLPKSQSAKPVKATAYRMLAIAGFGTKNEEAVLIEIDGENIKADTIFKPGSFTGVIRISGTDNKLLYEGNYIQGKLKGQRDYSQTNNSSLARAKKLDKQCFKNCVRTVIQSSLGKACFATCATCVYTPGWFTCPVCIACILGTAAACYWGC
jgi:hypothetical protein